MAEWKRVKWTEARQIGEALELEPEQLPEPEILPRPWFETLRARGESDLALRYLAVALPRYEAVAWAAHIINEGTAQVPIAPLERQALDRVLRWVDEPTDDYRQAAQEAASRARSGSAERLLGDALFMSGGSIAPTDLPAVIPPSDVCGQLAAAAVLVACHRGPDRAKAIDAALDSGDRVATDGLEALRKA